MSTVSSNGSNSRKSSRSSSETFVTGKKYYILNEDVVRRVLALLTIDLQAAALDAQDKKKPAAERNVAHKAAQLLIDLQGDIMFAEQGFFKGDE